MEDIALCGVNACLVIIVDEKGRNRKCKCLWCRDLFEEGPRYAVGLFDKLILKDSTGFTNFTRLTPTDFEELFLMVGGQIMKQDTKFRQTIQTSRETLLADLKVIMPRIKLQMSYTLATTCLFCIPLQFVSLCNPFRSGNQQHAILVAEHELRQAEQGFVSRHVYVYKVRHVAATKIARHVY